MTTRNSQDSTQLLQFSTDELEQVIANCKAAAKQQQLEGDGHVDVMTMSSVDVKGPLLQVSIEVKGLPVQAVVDTGAQCTVISRELLRQIGQHMRKHGKAFPKCILPSFKDGEDPVGVTCKSLQKYFFTYLWIILQSLPPFLFSLTVTYLV
jgi:hypothetical protein